MNCFKMAGAALAAFALAAPVSGEEITIKFATLAPEGSTWLKVLKEWNQELKEQSGGRLGFRIYPGGISGDEKDVVRKIRLGQLHAGGFTGVGLGEIAPATRILDTPFLFRSAAEADHVLKRFEKEWEGALARSGYVLLGWSEVGFVYVFTGAAVDSLLGLKGVKMWMWEGDPIAEATFKALGVRPIPLSITDVMTSLQTGLINGVYGSPLAIVALQWFTRTRWMFDHPLADASGAVLVSKAFFDKMPPDLKDLLVATGRRHLARLTELSRQENRASLETLKKNGIRFTAPKSEREIADYEAAGARARRQLAGRIYSADLLDKIEEALADLRRGNKK